MPTARSNSLLDDLRGVAQQFPDRPALAAVDGTEVRYGEAVETIERLIRRLEAADRGPTLRVALLLDNGPTELLMHIAALTAANSAPLNPALAPDEVQAALVRVNAGMVVRSIRDSERVTDDPAFAFEYRDPIGGPSSERGAGTLLLPTSGTTGEPKIVALTTANVRASASAIVRAFRLSPDDRYLAVMPFFHVHGLVSSIATLLSGGTVIAAPGLRTTEFFGWLEVLSATWCSASPTLLTTVLSRAKTTGHRPGVLRLRFIRSQSAPLLPSTATAVEALFRVPVVNSYGMTEAAGFIATQPLPPGQRTLGSVGNAVGCEVAILDDRGVPVSTGQIGEIGVRGPNIFSGYEDARPETGTLFRTGDLGRVGEDGALFITGRIRELINRGGEKIAPLEIDEVLSSHPAVVAAAAFAVEDPRLGEDVAAAVVSSQPLDELAMQAWIAQRLADHKVPRWIIQVEDIPTNRNGKVDRLRLAALYAAPLQRTRTLPDFNAPTPGVEHRIATLFAEVLDIRSIGRHDNFFDLGGDSFLATKVMDRVNGWYRRQLPAATFFRAPTVSGLSALIEAQSGSLRTTAGASVLLRDGGDAPPVFLVPGAVFSVTPYAELARLLPADRRVFGFVPELSTTGRHALDELTTLLRDEIRSIHPGPYDLVGYSSAGVIAFETALKLEDAGARVSSVILIDSYAPALLRSIAMRRRVAHYWHAVQMAGTTGEFGYFLRRVGRKLKIAALSFLFFARLPIASRSMAEVKLNLGPARTTLARSPSAPLLLIRAKRVDARFDRPQLGWVAHLQDFSEEWIDADHTSIMSGAPIQDVAAVIEANISATSPGRRVEVEGDSRG